MEIICGSYNNMLFGYQIDFNEGYKEKLSFTNEAHASLVKCLTISSNGLLASAGTDEIVKIFDLNKRKEVGSLMHLNGSITDMFFISNSHLLTSCEMGEISICDTKTWSLLHTLKHKSAVLSFSIHASGKLLISSCKDRSLQTWNLVTGRRAFVTNLKQPAEIVRFSPEGDKFLTINGCSIKLTNTKDGNLFGEIKSSNRIVSAIFINNEIICVGCEGGYIYFYIVSSFQLVHTISTSTVRIKSLIWSASSHLVSVTSDGFILIHLIHIQGGGSGIVSELKKCIATSHRWLCAVLHEPAGNVSAREENRIDKTAAGARRGQSESIGVGRKGKKIVPKNDDDGDDDDGEDDGSFPSSDGESDEEKSFKDQQSRLKRCLKANSERNGDKKRKLESRSISRSTGRRSKQRGEGYADDKSGGKSGERFKGGNKKDSFRFSKNKKTGSKEKSGERSDEKFGFKNSHKKAKKLLRRKGGNNMSSRRSTSKKFNSKK